MGRERRRYMCLFVMEVLKRYRESESEIEERN